MAEEAATEPDESATDDTATADRAAAARRATASAWLVVLVIGGLATALLLTMSFSASNTGVGVDGRSVTTSQFIDE